MSSSSRICCCLGLLLALSGPARAQTEAPAASARIEAAYRRAPSVGLLYELGRSAQIEGRRLAGLDLLRRYLNEVGEQAAPQRLQEITALLAAPRPPTSEINVGGEPGALLTMDGHLAGALPLALPLLVEPGTHHLRLERGKQRIEKQVSVPAGRMMNVRFTLSPLAVATEQAPAVMLSLDLQGGSPGMAARLQAVVGVALSRAPAILVQTSGEDVQFVLNLWVQVSPQSVQVRADLQDLLTGATGASQTISCTDASDGALARRLTPLIAQLILEASTRPRGELRVTSEVLGAVVTVDGRPAGLLPYERPAFTGLHVIRVELASYLPFEKEVTVSADQRTHLAVQMVRLPPPPLRPLRAVGAALVAGGLAGAGVGLGVLFGLDGLGADCVADYPDICLRRLSGAQSSLWAFIPAALELVTGGVLLSLDARQQRERRRAAARQARPGTGL